MEKWASLGWDNKFSNLAFFENIVCIFEENPKSPWVINTLEWWNRCIVPNIVKLADLNSTVRCQD
jgi:hypothetical protein